MSFFFQGPKKSTSLLRWNIYVIKGWTWLKQRYTTYLVNIELITKLVFVRNADYADLTSDNWTLQWPHFTQATLERITVDLELGNSCNRRLYPISLSLKSCKVGFSDKKHVEIKCWDHYLLLFQEQFEFALASVAEEVHAILKALPQWGHLVEKTAP